MKKIYLHIPDREKRAVVEKICREQDIGICGITGSDLRRTVAEICGVSLPKSGPHKAVPMMYMLPELLLFFGMDDKSLDRFLDAYNAAKAEKIRLKAVITPTNLGWTLYELAEALVQESGMFAGG